MDRFKGSNENQLLVQYNKRRLASHQHKRPKILGFNQRPATIDKIRVAHDRFGPYQASAFSTQSVVGLEQIVQLDSPSSPVALESPPQDPWTGLLAKIEPTAMPKMAKPMITAAPIKVGKMPWADLDLRSGFTELGCGFTELTSPIGNPFDRSSVNSEPKSESLVISKYSTPASRQNATPSSGPSTIIAVASASAVMQSSAITQAVANPCSTGRQVWGRSYERNVCRQTQSSSGSLLKSPRLCPRSRQLGIPRDQN